MNLKFSGFARDFREVKENRSAIRRASARCIIPLRRGHMNDTENVAFLDAKNVLLLVRKLARLDRERSSNRWLDGILADEEQKSGYKLKVPLLNQAAFLAMAYSALVWLRESYFINERAKKTLSDRVERIFDDSTLVVNTGPKAKKIDKSCPLELVRRVRNSLGHASVEIKERTFLFIDTNPRNSDDWAKIEMSWATVGQLCEFVILTCNDLLYGAANRLQPTIA